MKKGWTYKTLRDIADIKGGKRVPKGYKLQTTETNHPYIRVADFNDFGTIDMSNVQYISDDIFDQIKNYTITDKDLYVSIAGTIGKTGIIPSELNGANLTENACKLVFKEDINLRFVYLFTLSEIFKKQVVKATKQASQPKLALTRLAEIKISIPPLSEQERIVERLDAAFAQIDELKSNAERQLAEARALFQSALTQAMQPKTGWQEKTLGDICEIIRGKRFVRADIVDDGVPCIHYGDIYTYYGLSATKTRGYLRPELAKKMRFAKKNDVVVVQAGENNWDIGVGVAYFGEEPAAVHDACFILRHKQDPMFISYYLRSYNYHWYLLNYVHEGKICSFLKPALEKAPIPLPPLSEQHSIVSTLDSLKSNVDRLQENFTKITQECDALKQALLRQIFE